MRLDIRCEGVVINKVEKGREFRLAEIGEMLVQVEAGTDFHLLVPGRLVEAQEEPGVFLFGGVCVVQAGEFLAA